LKEANEKRDRQVSDEARMAALRNEAPDLAELVTEGRMSLSEAHAALADRKRHIREAIEDGKRLSVSRGSALLTAPRLRLRKLGAGAGHRLWVVPQGRPPAQSRGRRKEPVSRRTMRRATASPRSMRARIASTREGRGSGWSAIQLSKPRISPGGSRAVIDVAWVFGGAIAN
jgi:hypothetical protein